MADITDKMEALDVNDHSGTIQVVPPVNNMNAEAAARAREHGWAEPQQYDYQKYQAPINPPHGGGGAAAAAAAGGADGVVSSDPAVSGAATENGDEFPQWASSAAKYEWKEEYGDVGPRNEALEQMLFHSDLISRAGTCFEK